MIITEILRDKKHLTKIRFGDGGEILLDNDVLSENGLCVGTELSQEEVKALKYDSDYKRALSRAFWYLDRMDYTEKTLYEKLLKAGFNKRASAAVIARLCELGLVDDRRFAERLAERFKESNVSNREALHKMLLKGVPYELAKEILNNSDTDEEEQIKNLLEGKYAYRLTTENGAEKVYAALVRKGFSYGAVRSAMKKYIQELEFSEEY